MDQAVYHPASNSIFGVRGGILFKLNADTGALDDTFVFDPNCFSDGHIAYDSVTDRLLAACWSDKSYKSTSDQSDRPLYFIDPVTLLVASSVSMYAMFSETNNSDNAGNGIRDIICEPSSGFFWLGASCFNSFLPQTLIGRFNSTTPLAGGDIAKTEDAFGSHGAENLWNIAVRFSSLRVWVSLTEDQNKQLYEDSAPGGGSLVEISNVDDLTRVYYGVVFDQTGGDAYFTRRTQFIDQIDSTGAIVDTIDTADSIFVCYKARQHPTNRLLYFPGNGSNKIAVVDPTSGNALTIKTGFDLPFDIVFTPTKAFAVQRGAQGLKLIV